MNSTDLKYVTKNQAGNNSAPVMSITGFFHRQKIFKSDLG